MKVEKGRIINDIIEPNRKQYAIPVYQRNYDWTKSQCEKLFEDIVNSFYKAKTHFVGSIVNAEVESPNKITRYIIIDGQQRLTTIFILLKALLDLTDKDIDRERISDWLFNVDKYGDINIDDTNKLKLKPIKSDNVQLLNLMNGKFDDIDKSSNLFCNYELFKTLINKKLQEGMLIKEICEGIENLVCAMITLDDKDSPQEVFESINSTGLPLSISDLIRNYVLMTDTNQDVLYENYWMKIEMLIGKDSMCAFLIDYLNFKVDGFVKENDAYDSFKKLFINNNYSNEEMLKELLKYAEYYHCFLYGSDKYSKEINYNLSGLRNLKQTTIYMFLFRIFDDFNEGVCSEQELEKLLRFFVNYSVRRIVCEVGSNSLRGLYKTLYARIFCKIENKKQYYDAILSFFNQLTTKDSVPSDDEFILALCQNDLYHKNLACKFVLAMVENYGSKEQLVIKPLTIEHVMPQNKNVPQDWKEMLGEKWAEIRIKYLHTLGNLTLTGYNSELSDKSFDDKKELLAANNSKMVVLNADIINQDVWNESAIEERAKNLSAKIVSIFNIEHPENEISFADESYTEYSCDDPDNAKYKVPNYYILQGERVGVKDFSEMLGSVIKNLYELDRSIIERIAKTNEKIIEWSQRIWLTYDKDLLTYSASLDDTGIYYNTNLSAPDKMYFIRALLDEYGIDRSDFVYSAKVYNNQ